MWFAKEANGFRAWFIIVQTGGTLATGGLSGDFTITVVNPNDTISISPTVSESTIKPGLYTFLIPNNFLIANGIGSYAIVIEVSIAPPPPIVTDAFSSVLQVSEKIFDDLSTQSSVDAVQQTLDTLFEAIIAEDLTVQGGSTTSIVLTDSTHRDNAYDGMLLVIIHSGSTETNPLIVARTIDNYQQTNGTFTVIPSLPFIPEDGDRAIVLSRTSLENDTIASSVWIVDSTSTIPDTFGGLIDVISNQTNLIPGLV